MSNAANQVQGSPWHVGEVAVQRSAGVAEKMAAHRRVIRDHMIGKLFDVARNFLRGKLA